MMTFYRRNLPHWQPPGRDIFLTWRLKGSLPEHIRGIPSKHMPGRRFVELDTALDRADVGPLWLADSRVAECVLGVLMSGRDQRLFESHAFVVMSNHIHVLMTPLLSIANVTRRVKGATARQANRILDLTGNYFWQDESFDHWVRTPGEWQKIRTYIEENPVKAGLVARAKEWPWSSASHPPK